MTYRLDINTFKENFAAFLQNGRFLVYADVGADANSTYVYIDSIRAVNYSEITVDDMVVVVGGQVDFTSIEAFAEATESLHGRTRVYFAADEQTLLKNGNQTKPKHVPGTPYWVITNTNTGRKCSMIEHIMQSMQFPAELIEKVCGTI